MFLGRFIISNEMNHMSLHRLLAVQHKNAYIDMQNQNKQRNNLSYTHSQIHF